MNIPILLESVANIISLVFSIEVDESLISILSPILILRSVISFFVKLIPLSVLFSESNTKYSPLSLNIFLGFLMSSILLKSIATIGSFILFTRSSTSNCSWISANKIEALPDSSLYLSLLSNERSLAFIIFLASIKDILASGWSLIESISAFSILFSAWVNKLA